MAVHGDFASLKAFVKKVGGMKSATLQIATAAGPKLQALLNAEFARGGGPYGEGWQPKKDGGAPFAGGGSGWVIVKVVAGGNRIRTTIVPPGVFHQRGARHGGKKSKRAMRASLRKMGHDRASITSAIAARESSRGAKLPARPIIPEESRGIPPEWRAAILQSARTVMASYGARPSTGGA